MKYVVLLRGVNVGGKNKIEMKRLKIFFESFGYQDVATYLNSGNIIFKSTIKPDQKLIEARLMKMLKFKILTLIKTEKEMQEIAGAIPESWENNSEQRTDVAYLTNKINRKETLDELPFNKQYIELRFTNGAIIWNILRKNIYKSGLGKLISHQHYQQMTMRNVNTARYLGKL